MYEAKVSPEGFLSSCLLRETCQDIQARFILYSGHWAENHVNKDEPLTAPSCQNIINETDVFYLFFYLQSRLTLINLTNAIYKSASCHFYPQ